MVENAESQSGATLCSTNDPRITKIGVFLRKSRLDELPQFINVLVGDMLIIGPRPERPEFCQELNELIPFFSERTFGVYPGITGLAQVNQGYDTSIDDVREKVAFDHRYALALSDPISWLQMDITIALRTIVVMLRGKGQ